MKKIITGLLAIGLLTLVTVGVVSADHTSECDYTLTWNSGDYNVVVGIDETARGYYFEMDGDAEVTALAADRYRVHFSGADAGERQTFYAQAHSPGGASCEVHGAFRVKTG